MRTTLTLDEDVSALLERVMARRRASLKAVVNDALRAGLRQMTAPAQPAKPYRTKGVSLGRCLVGSVDDVADVLALAEGETYK